VGDGAQRAFRRRKSQQSTIVSTAHMDAKNRVTAMKYATFAQPIKGFRFSALALHFEQSTFAGAAV
jgi:hypothetical protein